MAQIITQINTNVHTSWQKELAQVVTDATELLQLLNIDAAQYQQHFAAKQLFAVRVPRPFIAKMQQGDINDPLLRQVMPLSAEFNQVEGFSADPLHEQQSVQPSLLHKYYNRVLLITKAGCAVNCRYCFRRHFPYQEHQGNKQALTPAINYIAEHSEIEEVILSGGDPLMASDQHLSWLVSELEQIHHVSRLRIHTRLPVTIPQRITSELVHLLANTRLKPSVVFHINHANELDKLFVEAIEPLRQARIPLFNQAVLLKGVNDNLASLVNLSEQLFDSGIQPYYLHLLDKVQGAAHFEVAEADAIKLYQQLLARLSGFLVPKLVREIAGEANKTPINLR